MLTKQKVKALSKVLVVALLWAAMTAVGAAPSDGGRLFPIESGKLVGFIDASGTVIIQPQFGGAKEFREGLAPAQAADSGKWGYIDRTGTFAIAPQYKLAFPFSEGLAEVQFEPAGGGYIDYSGRLVFQGSGGYVRDGMVAHRTTEKTIFTDTSGATLFEAPGEAWQVGGGLIAFWENGQMGFMDRQGNVVIRPAYHRVVDWRDRQFEERITPVCTGPLRGKFGFIDRSGKIVVDFQFEWAEQFFDGLAMVSQDGKYGYVNTAGEVAIPLQFDGADHFAEGLAAVKVGDSWGFIDTQGRIVIEPQYLSRMWGSPMIFNEGLAAVRTETGTGFINKASEMVVPAIYRSVVDFSGGLALIEDPRNPIYVNQRGEVVWPHNSRRSQGSGT